MALKGHIQYETQFENTVLLNGLAYYNEQVFQMY